MDRKEWTKTLVRAGRRDEVRTIYAKHAESTQQAYDAIRADETRTPAYRRQEMARTYASTIDQVNAELERAARGARTADANDAATVFGVKGIPGDPASLTISRRDAADRAAAITDTTELRDLLKRAERSGDEVLARAVGERALEIRALDVANAFLDERPKMHDAARRLWDAEQADKGFDIGLLGGLSSLRPSELSDLDEDGILGLAETKQNLEPGPARKLFDSSSGHTHPHDRPAESKLIQTGGGAY